MENYNLCSTAKLVDQTTGTLTLSREDDNRMAQIVSEKYLLVKTSLNPGLGTKTIFVFVPYLDIPILYPLFSRKEASLFCPPVCLSVTDTL